MEALAAVGLASNVLQFVEFATKIVRTSNELRQDATSFENRSHAAVAAHLGDLTQKMLDESRAAGQAAVMPSPEDKAYQAVLEGCLDLAKQLLKRVERCGASQGQPTGFVGRTRRAFKCVWNKQEINDITTRLQNFRGEITAYYVYQIQKTQLEDRVNLLSRSDLDTVQAQVAQLGASIEGISLQQSSLGTDFGCSQRTTLEALASLKNDNMQLITGVNQATSALLGQKLLLQTVIQETLGEFRKEMLPLVKHEFHSAAEAELAKAHGLMLHEIRGMMFEEILGRQSDNHRSSAESQLSCDTKMQTSTSIGEDMTFCSEDRVLYDLDRPANRSPERTHEKTTIVTQDTEWEKFTVFASFHVRSRHTVSFDQQFRATETCEVTARVSPTSRCWFATGCEINFKRVTDVRGVQSWTWKQPQTYRVLDIKHQVFQCIRDNDVDTVRRMLSNRTMFPSDRNQGGLTPLHVSVICGNLEICKSLIQCGADPLAENIFGFTPLLYSLLMESRQQTPKLLEMCLCLGQVQQQSEISRLEEKLSLLVVWRLIPLSYNTLSIERSIQDWISACRFLGIDLQELGDSKFRESLIREFSLWYKYDSSGLLDGQDAASAVVDFALEGTRVLFNSLMNTTANEDKWDTRINVSIAASFLAVCLYKARESGTLHTSAGDDHEFAYRGFLVDQGVWATLKFLDTIIANGIDAYPDSIFDTHKGLTLYDWFWDDDLEEMWEDILEEHGFDPDWAWEENEKRKNKTRGNATGRDAEVETPASQALEVKRRRAYTADDDA